ncbi:hypothetical protein QBC34DRAFT_489690 [Podospora aff. communis PSN243]|uniref:Uncharacterized protein n=1 Tax=Podospora aff. communis PSN243 TaxID=3040156 RepID=A0AAV9H4Q3_9PEZI|nr:hypothetical protein QBC34DRAFT_489690 [Podospora aff. communis PSN243]
MGSEFLSLPPELRIMIYELLLVSPAPIIIVGREAKGLFRNLSGKKFPRFVALPYGALPSGAALMRTSKKICEETRHVLYSQNTFQFPERCKVGLARSIAHMDLFLEGIGPDCAKQIKSVRIPVPDSERFVAHKEYTKRIQQLQQTCPELSDIAICFRPQHFLRAVAFGKKKRIDTNHMNRLRTFVRNVAQVADKKVTTDAAQVADEKVTMTFRFPVTKREKVPNDELPVARCAERRLEVAAGRHRVRFVQDTYTMLLHHHRIMVSDTAEALLKWVNQKSI